MRVPRRSRFCGWIRSRHRLDAARLAGAALSGRRLDATPCGPAVVRPWLFIGGCSQAICRADLRLHQCRDHHNSFYRTCVLESMNKGCAWSAYSAYSAWVIQFRRRLASRVDSRWNDRRHGPVLAADAPSTPPPPCELFGCSPTLPNGRTRALPILKTLVHSNTPPPPSPKCTYM